MTASDLHQPAHQWPATPPPARRKPKWPLVAFLAVLAAASLGYLAYALAPAGGEPVGAISMSTTADARTQTFEPTVNACDPGDNGTQITDSGRTLLVDGRATNNAYAPGLDPEGLGCLLDGLSVTEAVRAHMVSTRALDGRQQDAWAGFSASWSFHPDDGLDMIITRQD